MHSILWERTATIATYPIARPKSAQKTKAYENLRIEKQTGSPGMKGQPLECRSKADEKIKHSPAECGSCGCNPDNHPEQLVSARQLIEIYPHFFKMYRTPCL